MVDQEFLGDKSWCKCAERLDSLWPNRKEWTDVHSDGQIAPCHLVEWLAGFLYRYKAHINDYTENTQSTHKQRQMEKKILGRKEERSSRAFKRS